MKKHHFLVLPLILLALLGLGLLATPRASAHTLQPSPPDGSCTPSIDALVSAHGNPRTVTITLNECAQQLILNGISPDQVSTFDVMYRWIDLPFPAGDSFHIVNGDDPTVDQPANSIGTSTLRTIVTNELQNLEADYAACGNTNATLTTWADLNITGDQFYQQLIANALIQTGCDQSLIPGPR